MSAPGTHLRGWVRQLILSERGVTNSAISVVATEASAASSSASAAVAAANAASTAAATAGTLANDAQTTADGRGVVMYASSAPTVHPDSTSLTTADVWFQTAVISGTTVVLSANQWTGSAWAAVPYSNAAIYANIDAGKITAGILSAIDLVGNFIETQSGVGTGSAPHVVTGVLMDTSGDIYCYGPDGPVLAFTASTGALVLTGASGTFAAPTINGGTVIGATVETSSSGQRVVLNGSGDSVDFYDSTGAHVASLSGLSGNLDINADVQIDAALTVVGTTVFEGNVTVDLNLTVDSALNVLGATTLGNAPTDTVTVAGPLTAEQPMTVGSAAGSSGTTTSTLVLAGSGTAYNTLQISNPPTTGSAANVYIGGSGRLNESTSSKRFKKNIRTLKTGDARKILDLRPVTYRSKCRDDNPDRTYLGLVAEEVDKVMPEVVERDKDGTTPRYVGYERLVAPLIAVVKDQDTRIAALEAQVAELTKLVKGAS